jgi:hypothetical protein
MGGRWLLPLALALATLIGLSYSCATSSGSTYSSAESGEAAAARAKKPAQPDRPPAAPNPPVANRPAPPPAVPPPSYPSGADHASRQPLPEQGSIFFIFGGSAAPARLSTGSLLLENIEPGASVYVDGSFHLGASMTLTEGQHDLRVIRFGYRDFEVPVRISEGRATRLRIDYVKAPFEIRGVDARPRGFDPADPGYLGSCEIQILVSARGEGSASVLDSNGRPQRDLGRLSFEGPASSLRWDGRDDRGRALPPGEYLVRVKASGEDGTSVAADAKVTLLSGLFSRSTTLYSGVSGAVFAPDARSLESGKLEASSGAELHLAPKGNTLLGLGTAQAGMRIGLPSTLGNAELDVSYMAVFWQGMPDANSYSVTGAWKFSLGGAPFASPTAAALYVKGTIARFFDQDPQDPTTPSWDGTTRYSGLSAGLPLEYDSGSVRFFVSPEIEVSDFYPNWASSPVAGVPAPQWTTPGNFAWAYLRLGLEATAERYSIGFSGALRTTPFGGVFELAGPYPLGVELRWHAPSSPLVLSFIATGEIQDLSDYYFGAGLGVGFRY